MTEQKQNIAARLSEQEIESFADALAELATEVNLNDLEGGDTLETLILDREIISLLDAVANLTIADFFSVWGRAKEINPDNIRIMQLLFELRRKPTLSS